jgi:hypothetical protein
MFLRGDWRAKEARWRRRAHPGAGYRLPLDLKCTLWADTDAGGLISLDKHRGPPRLSLAGTWNTTPMITGKPRGISYTIDGTFPS